ncbi:hypothetical protein TcWFU_006782 [Taenia crassiceps]|uniref:Uncharacterized protein n=1 Tax=Taenia crassiceps TaxID=6207 RepID=A0ABR4QDY1_9CEST
MVVSTMRSYLCTVPPRLTPHHCDTCQQYSLYRLGSLEFQKTAKEDIVWRKVEKRRIRAGTKTGSPDLPGNPDVVIPSVGPKIQ